MKAGGFVGGATVVLCAVAFSGGGGDTITSPAPAVAAPAVAAVGACTSLPPGLNATQTDIARRAVAAATRSGTGDEGAVIIIAAGIVESGLRNLTYGDRDSLGWLQQRPSQGWRNATDVDRGADDFFTDMKTRIPDWRTRPPGQVAQLVQRSAYPHRYGKQVDRARGIVTAITGTCTVPTPPAPATGRAAAMLTWAQTQVGKPYRLGANGPDAWDCSSFSRAALTRAGVTGMPRTAHTQWQWCKAGNCTRVPEGSEQPGDLAFWDSYLGPTQVGHVAIIRNPARRETVDARSTIKGVINGSYPRANTKAIMEIWRPNVLTGRS